jgi:hypothetical protein
VLKPKGSVLIIQPSIENPIVEVEIKGEIVFREETNEKVFRSYLRATKEAIDRSIQKGLFEKVTEAIIPGKTIYHCDRYDSLSDWVEDSRRYCEDIEELDAITERIKLLVLDQKHKVREYWREYNLLMQKVS